MERVGVILRIIFLMVGVVMAYKEAGIFTALILAYLILHGEGLHILLKQLARATVDLTGVLRAVKNGLEKQEDKK